MHVAPRIVTTVAVGLLPVIAVAQAHEEAAESSHVLWVGLANGTEGEALMATQLRSLVRKYDVEPWVLTRSVLIDENQIPHSHPILTIHTRHIGEELELLSTFVHEQLHWLEEGSWLAGFQAAMKDLRSSLSGCALECRRRRARRRKYVPPSSRVRLGIPGNGFVSWRGDSARNAGRDHSLPVDLR